MKRFSSFLISCIGSFFIFSFLFFVVPVCIYVYFYGYAGLSVIDIVSTIGNPPIWLTFLYGLISPWGLALSILLFLFSVIFLGIFLHKKWGYILFAFLVWCIVFGSVLLMVLKTYTYMPSFVSSIIAGSFLVVGGIVSWYLCFWGRKKNKMYPLYFPLLVWGFSFLMFVFCLHFFPDSVLSVDYISIDGILSVSYTPWSLDIKEILFGISFFFLLFCSRWSFSLILSFYTKEKSPVLYPWRSFFFGFIFLGLLGISCFVYTHREIPIEAPWVSHGYVFSLSGVNTSNTGMDRFWMGQETSDSLQKQLNSSSPTVWLSGYTRVQSLLMSGSSVMGMHSLFALEKLAFSGLQVLLPQFTLSQKQQLLTLLLAIDSDNLLDLTFKHEYVFVHVMGIEHIRDYLQESHSRLPKFLYDPEYTEYLMKCYFYDAISLKGLVTPPVYPLDSYNVFGSAVLNALLPRFDYFLKISRQQEQQRAALIAALE